MSVPTKAAYEQILLDLQRQIIQAKEEVERQQAKITDLQTAIKVIEVQIKAQSNTTATISIEEPTKSVYAGLGVVAAGEKFLESYQDLASSRLIAEELKRGGYPTKAKKFATTVHSLFYRDYKTNLDTRLVYRNYKWGLKSWELDKKGRVIHREAALFLTRDSQSSVS
jgi:hypothetical protein